MGPGTLTQKGPAYTLDLGVLAHGGAAETIVLGLQRLANVPADALAGSFELSGSGFGSLEFAPFGDLTGTDAIPIGTLAFEPDDIGAFSETKILSPTVSDPRFSVSLTPETLVIEAQEPCFARGTRLATTRGEIAVENLREGDLAITAAGAVRPIAWVGHVDVECRRHPRPESVIPVRVRRGAFGADLPSRDVLLSPSHAVFAEGVLIPVGRLVNGASITREEHTGHVTYYHVELPTHDVVLAEGVPVESYLDEGNRLSFVNGQAYRLLHPGRPPTSWADACAPLCENGPEVAKVRRHLRGRLPELGFVPEPERQLELWVGGIRLAPHLVRGGSYHVKLPPNVGELRLISSSGIPAGLDDQSDDTRRLGAMLGFLLLEGAWIRLDSPVLADGLYDIERDAGGTWRWTNGMGIVRLPPVGSPRLLELFVHNIKHGWLAPESTGRDRVA